MSAADLSERTNPVALERGSPLPIGHAQCRSLIQKLSARCTPELRGGPPQVDTNGRIGQAEIVCNLLVLLATQLTRDHFALSAAEQVEPLAFRRRGHLGFLGGCAGVAGMVSYPGDSGLLCLQAEVLAALGRYGEAEACFRAQLIGGESHERFAYADRTIVPIAVRHQLSQLLLLTGRWCEAEQLAMCIVKDRPAFGFAWLTLGEAALAAGDDQRFETIAQSLGTSDESEVGRIVLQAARFRSGGHPQDALSVVDAAQKTRPHHVALRKAKAMALFDAGAGGERMQNAIDQALASDPLCMRIWAIRRATGPLDVHGLATRAGRFTATWPARCWLELTSPR